MNMPSMYLPSTTFGRALKALGAIAAILTLASCAMNTSSNRLGKTHEGLVEVERGNFDHVFMQPDTTLPKFSRLYIAEPEVTMSKYWLRDRRTDYSSRDLERIQSSYGRALKEALGEVLAERSGISIVDSPAEADMILQPSLLNLNIYAPDLSFRGRTDDYVEVAGNATVNLDFVDPQSNEVIAQFVDHRETPAIVPGRLEETNRATNFRLFRRLMERWSHNLALYLHKEGIVAMR
jgi:hypothetical protein